MLLPLNINYLQKEYVLQNLKKLIKFKFNKTKFKFK